MPTIYPSIEDCTIQIICKVEDKVIYHTLKQVLDCFGFITNLCVVNYDGKGSISSKYPKKNNFVFCANDTEYQRLKNQFIDNSELSTVEYPRYFPMYFSGEAKYFQPDYSFYKSIFFAKINDFFTDERFMKMVNFRLNMLEEVVHDYSIDTAVSLAFGSPCCDYFYFKLNLEAIKANNWGTEAYEIFVDELRKYLLVRGTSLVKVLYLYAHVLDSDLRDFERASDAYKGVLKTIGNNSDLYYCYAMALLNQNRPDYYNEIVNNLNKALQYDSASYRALNGLACVYRCLGDFDMERKYCVMLASMLEYSKENGLFIDDEEKHYENAKARLKQLEQLELAWDTSMNLFCRVQPLNVPLTSFFIPVLAAYQDRYAQ